MANEDKHAFLLAGFHEKINNPGYRHIGKQLRKLGFKVHFLNIHWNHKTMSDYIAQFDAAYIKHQARVNLVLGFSFGAMIAYLSATKLQPNYLFLCSLSPYFREDLSGLTKADRLAIGRKRYVDFHKYSFNSVNRIDSRCILFLGEKEIPEVKLRVNAAHAALPGSELVIIEKGKHSINQQEYFNTINNKLAKLLL